MSSFPAARSQAPAGHRRLPRTEARKPARNQVSSAWRKLRLAAIGAPVVCIRTASRKRFCSRQVTCNRGPFPSEQAALKLLYLAVRNLEDFRGPNAGIRSSGWKQALQAFTIYFDGRISIP